MLVGRIDRILILGSVNIAMILAEFSTYPSIYWNPWNPIFACEDPSINVRIGDTINFLCPSDEYKFYIPPSTDVNMIYENLYFLNDEEMKYHSCNATRARRLLRCDDKQATAKYYTISFRDVPTSAHSIEFEKGKTYYLIGTGFRSLDQLDNLVGGSCSKTGGVEQFRLRLKIKVCKNDDDCDICRSEGCYYKECKSSCSKWSYYDSKMSNGECMKVERRVCKYPYLDNKNKTEYRETNQSIALCETLSPSRSLQTGDLKCDQTYKIILFILVPVVLLFFLVYHFRVFRVCKEQQKCVTNVEADAEKQTEEPLQQGQQSQERGKANCSFRESILTKLDRNCSRNT